MEDYYDLTEQQRLVREDKHAMTTIVFEGEKYASVVDIITWLLECADMTDASEDGSPLASKTMRLLAESLCDKLL